jgi:NAD+ synthase (glutamine-hydrolysing)
MRIAIGQINSTIADFDGNRSKILSFAKEAGKQGVDLVLFPELALCGYPPMDLLDQDKFTEDNLRSLHILQQELKEQGCAQVAVGLGYVNRSPFEGGKALVNQYGIILDGKIVHEQIKTLLPTYDVFDEARNFEPARSWDIFEYKGESIGIAICEDLWRETATPGTHYRADPVDALMQKGATLLLVPSASPYYAGKEKVRRGLAARVARRGNLALVYINAVGANDQIIFDGRSFVMLPGDTEPVVQAEAFQENLLIVEQNNWTNEQKRLNNEQKRLNNQQKILDNPPQNQSLSDTELDTLEEALVLGIREYMQKCGFKKAHLNLSGGIDSALVAYLGCKAIGPENIATYSEPSRFSSQGSKDDAAELAKNLGCSYTTIPIEPVFKAFLSSLEPVFQGRPFDTAEENLQARIRGMLAMAISNKFNSMLLTTGNKSELAMGYCTLYGDMCGALAPIGDLFKTEVFALCRRINARSSAGPIPQAIIDKPPSAELRPNQKDQDSLPPYDVLDAILKCYLFDNLSCDEIAARTGYDPALVKSVIHTVARAEFKRRQAPPVLKVSQRAFGLGRRMPIARAINEENST